LEGYIEELETAFEDAVMTVLDGFAGGKERY
jgi:hypothetical protein